MIEQTSSSKDFIRRTFRNKTEASSYFSQTLHGHKIGKPIRDADEVAFLHHLVRCHPRFEEKAGGLLIFGFEVRRKDYGKPCFFLVRADGLAMHFSFKKCLDEVYGVKRRKQ